MRLLCILGAALLAGCGCSTAGDHAPATPANVDAPAEAADAAQRPTVILSPEGRPEARVTVALARTPQEHARGLMYVQNLPVDDGMLFLSETEEIRTFWMKNCLIPLDMIFIRADFTVAGIVANAEPLTETGRSVNQPSQYVLEVNGGWAAAHGVTEGTRIRFENVTP